MGLALPITMSRSCHTLPCLCTVQMTDIKPTETFMYAYSHFPTYPSKPNRKLFSFEGSNSALASPSQGKDTQNIYHCTSMTSKVMSDPWRNRGPTAVGGASHNYITGSGRRTGPTQLHRLFNHIKLGYIKHDQQLLQRVVSQLHKQN